MTFNKIKSAALAAIMIFVCSVFAGCGFAVYDKIGDYGNFISNLFQYMSDDSQNTDNDYTDGGHKDPPLKSVPEIEGFSSMFNNAVFDYAKGFSGRSTFAVLDGKNIIISKDENIDKNVYESENLTDFELIFDKYIFNDGALRGVKDIYGNTILPAQYESIEISGETILAKKNGIADIYVNGVVIRENITAGVSLINEKYLLTDNGVFNLDMTPLTAGTYHIINILNSNTFLIYDELLIGAADMDFKIIVPPVYSIIYNYINGYLCVKNGNTYEVRNSDGGILFSHSEMEPLYYDGQYLIFKQGAFLGVADKNFNKITEPSFISIQNNMVYNDFIITGINIKQIYSLKHKTLYEDLYSEIIPFGDYFICAGIEGKYSLRDKKLNVLINNCDYIDWLGEILLVSKSGKYYFYSLNID